jgi:hypothetical protein
MDKRILDQLTKLAYPGATITYTEMNNSNDNNTITDTSGEIKNAIKQGKIGEIVKAIYSGSKFTNKIATDNKGAIKVLDNNGNLQDIKVTTNNGVMRMEDPVNRRVTTIQYMVPEKQVEKIKSLQDQIIDELKKKKMTDKEVLMLIKNLTNGK